MNKESIVGIFVIVTLTSLYLGFNYLKGIDFFSPTNKYYVIYDNIDKLSVSSPVLINGYTVGRVNAIDIMQHDNNRILVEINIDEKVVLGDSAAAVLSADFLGNKSIFLDVGNLAFPLQRGDTLYADVATGIFDMFTETAEPVASNIQSSLLKLDVALDMLMLNSARLDTIFLKLGRTPMLLNKTLLTSNEGIEKLTSSFIQTSDQLASTLKSMEPTVNNLNETSHKLKQLEFQKTLLGIQQAIKQLSDTFSKINQGDNTINKLLTEDSLYQNINTLLLRLDTLVTNFNDEPKHFLAPLGKSRRRIKKDREKSKK